MASSRQYTEWKEPYRHDIVQFLISRGAQTDILMASAIGDLSLVERILNDDPETIRITVNERYFPKVRWQHLHRWFWLDQVAAYDCTPV